ncbi:MAG TPA: LysM peptidoglycan-binding domain-containing protein [Oceanospirillales bacterium]|nr:LysM peptidoglycan-binding domain-containing protein [Oceanospirillales bacterium]
MRTVVSYTMLLVLVLTLNACHRRNPAPVTDSAHRQQRNQPIHAKHRSLIQQRAKPKYVLVKKGDTLYSIGFNHDTDYKTLAKINHIPAPYHIYPGQRIKLFGTKIKSSKVVTSPIKAKKKLQQQANHSTVARESTNKPEKKPTSVTKKPIVASKKPTAKPNPKPVIKKPVVSTTGKQTAPSSNVRWIWPVKGRIISTFSQADVSRKGIDIAAKRGQAVYASNNGTVVYSGDGLRGYGELIIIKHSNNLLSAYAHNSQRLVKEGQTVRQGQEIAKSGIGTDGMALLHFEIRRNGQPVNPMSYLPKP